MEIITIIIRQDGSVGLDYSSGVRPSMGMQACDAVRAKFLELWMAEQKRLQAAEVDRLVRERLELERAEQEDKE